MCGIFGWQIQEGSLSEGRQLLFATSLASLNEERGGHSWGLALCSPIEEEEGSQPRVVRAVGEISNGVHYLVGQTAFFGHTRFATVGDKTVPNAHPFDMGRILGAHNGAVYNHLELKRKYHRDAFEVDSMHLFAHLNEGLDFSDVEGYGAMVWLEKDTPKRIYLCKLRGGSLTVWGFGEYKAILGVAFSSDRDHLKFAASRAGIAPKDHFPYNIEIGHVYYIEEGKLWEADERKYDVVPRTGGSYTCENKSWRGQQPWGYGDGEWDGYPDVSSGGVTESSKTKRHGRVHSEFVNEKTPTALPSGNVTSPGAGHVGSDDDDVRGNAPSDLLLPQGHLPMSTD